MEKKYSHSIVAQYKALLPAIQRISLLMSEYTNSGPLHVVFDIDDTCISDDTHGGTPNIQVKHLLEVARAHGCKIHLVTAREKSSEVLKWTREELKRHGIAYDSLALAPKKARETMATVAAWKHTEREKHKPVLLTVGDQWGDCIKIAAEDEIDALNEKHRTNEFPWTILKPNDGVTVYGLKLMAQKN